MDVSPPRPQEPVKRPPISVNLKAINTEAETSTGFNSAASYQKRLKIVITPSLISDEYIILEPEVSQMEQKVPKTTPSRVGSTPRGSPYEPPSVSGTPVPADFKIDITKVRDERPNAAGKKGEVDVSYNVAELKSYLADINRYRRERNLPRLIANDRKGYVDAIREFFGAEPDVGGIGRKPKAKAKAKALALDQREKAKAKPTSIQVTTAISPRGPVTLKSKKPAAKPVTPPESEEEESEEAERSEEESIEPIERGKGSESDVEELTSRMKTTTISKKPVAPSESESETSSSEEEERPQKKPIGLARSKR